LDNKAFDIIDARCNREGEIFTFILLSHLFSSFYITIALYVTSTVY